MALEKICVLLFNGAELLDFAGPLQVFAAYQYMFESETCSVTTIGLNSEIKVSKLGMTITPDSKIEDYKANADLFIIPGGMGTREIIKSEEELKQIDKMVHRSHCIASVCTGSLILAKLGHLSNLKATTHFAATDILTKLDPSIILDRSRRFHDHGKFIIAEGVSAGIDMSFHILEREAGKNKSEEVRRYIEYYPGKV